MIKESVDIKTEAFLSLFQCFGSETTDRIRRHHPDNGGMSRFEKIPRMRMGVPLTEEAAYTVSCTVYRLLC